MAINVIDTIEPKGSGVFPVVRENNIWGGARSVQSISDRDAINSAVRSTGMLVYVLDTNQEYRLIGGVSNANWQLANASGGTGSGYTHTQSVAASSWVMEHNLGFDPSITLVHASGYGLMGTITYPSGGTVALARFNKSYVGSGYMS